jgi:hypothetical protein
LRETKLRAGLWRQGSQPNVASAVLPIGVAVMMRQPVRYMEIQKWVYRRHGFIPKTCWIAHCKELCGLPLGIAANRQQGAGRSDPCPLEKQVAIKQAFRHFGMLSTPDE